MNHTNNINPPEFRENENEIETFSKWDELNIHPTILRGIYSYGLEIPSPIQSKSIISVCNGRDIIAQAQSGTGKTASFTIGTLARIDTTNDDLQAIILAPTRELATQIGSVVSSIGCMMDGLSVKTIVGGSTIIDDMNDMRQNPPHIIVGCPGRVNDMIRRRYINCDTVKILVLDEADEMLSIGFMEQIKNIIVKLSNEAQIALFSATLPSNIRMITTKFMKNPLYVTVKAESLTLEGIKQYYIAINSDHEKYMTLKDIYNSISMSQCIIYCNSVNRVKYLHNCMMEDNFPVSCIHSDMSKQERDSTFNDFKIGSTRVLISSDVTARGIDIQQVSVVINFDLPRDIHTYLHRIGRSGRFGRKGCGINLITYRDVQKMKEIENYYATEIKELPSDFSAIG